MTLTVRARRPGIRSLLLLIVSEGKMVVRDTAGLIVPIGLPLLILLTSAGSAGEHVIANGMTALDLYVLPLVLVIMVATIGIINMPSFLAYYRRSGILRRLAVTPASPFMVLAAQAIVSALQIIAGIAVASTVAALAFGANPPVDLAAALGVLALAMAALYGVGLIVAAIAPTPNAAVALGLVAFFALGALGGMFGGREALPDPVAEVGGWLPFGAAVEALTAAWAGVPVPIGQLLSLGITVVIGAVTAALLFRWE
ncbi:ABC transporter permease [Microbacterium esteraromaticum]|uniref:ABC transporter permease n=1 Tax=Microbacterium esteraromaticum TaxID=57043 RepID=A0A7D8AJ20_9MICO|nr:ABC transporter permease [Microbacterium esteraromaticum]QMU97125.1 ABC transporter permease [Microbacterium esteraromaticum]